MLLDAATASHFRDNEVMVQPVILDNQVLISYIQDGSAACGRDKPFLTARGASRSVGGPPVSGFADEDSHALRTAARYSSGIYNADGGVQEIVDYNRPTNRLSVDGYDGVLTAYL
jgi:hypothetical protein